MITPKKVLTALGNGLRRLAAPPVVVLIYHRVTRLSSDPQQLAVSPEHFRQQLRYLKEQFDLFRFEEPWVPRKRPGVVVTFDDGYADNALEALPILEAEGVPATIFVATGWVGTDQETWWDELERIFLTGQGTTVQFPQDALREAYFRAHREIKPLTVDNRQRRLAELRRQWAIPEGGRSTHRAVTIAELKTLADSPWITLGAHTVNHPQLSSLDRSSQRYEILESRRALETWTQAPISVFSYPYGTKSDYNHDTLDLVAEAGFAKVSANFNGPWFRGHSPWELPRQLVRDWDGATFGSKMQNFQYV